MRSYFGHFPWYLRLVLLFFFYEIPENNGDHFIQQDEHMKNEDQVFHETFDNTLNTTNEMDIPMGQSAAQIVPDGDQIPTGNYKRVQNKKSQKKTQKRKLCVFFTPFFTHFNNFKLIFILPVGTQMKSTTHH